MRPTLYNSQGQQQEIPPVLVEPQSFRFINLRDWAAIGGDSFKSGNIKLFHTGKDLVLGAQIYLTDETHSLGFEEKLAEKTKFDSRRQEAVWWMPSNQANVQIIVTNTTDELLPFTGTLAKKPNKTGEPQSFQLAAHETKVFVLRQDFANSNQFANSEIVGLSLQHAGAKDALLARVMVKETNLGYSNVVQFSNPSGGKSSEYQGVGFQIADVAGEQMTPVIVARNVGCETATITAKIPYTRVDGTKGNITLPQEQLSSGEMRLLNVQSIIRRVRREQIKIASLEVEYNTASGSVIVAAHSVSENHNQVFRVPMWDPLGQRSPTGGYPWRIEGTSQTETYIKNITDQEEDYVAFLVWENGGMYMIGLKSIGSHETVHIDIKKLRDEQTPDFRGRTIPLNISSGQLQWTLRRKDSLPDDDVRANLALIGRSEQVDVTKGIVNNYSCQNCCSGNFIAGRIKPSIPLQSNNIKVGDSRRYIAEEDSETCYGFPNSYEVTSPITWGTSDANIASVIVGNVFGESPGIATISATWSVQRSLVYPCTPGGGGYSRLLDGGEPEPCEEKKERENKIKSKRDIKPNIAECGTCSYRRGVFTAYTTVSVYKPCAVPTNFRMVAPGVDVGRGTLYFNNFSWDSSTGNLEDLSSCSIGEIVTYPGVGDYYPPSPPFPVGGFSNPLTIDSIATTGRLWDHHYSGNGGDTVVFVKPYSNASFTGVQYYRYSCPCMNNGDYVNLMGPIDIVRSITQVDETTWKYTVTKLGYSATINPLP